MGAGALTICHNRTAVQIREDVKRMVQRPTMQPKPAGVKVFGMSLMETKELGLLEDGVPQAVRSMVEFLREHALQQEGLFRVSSSVRMVDGLRRRLEAGEEVSEVLKGADPCAVASLLKQYLRDLPEGLVHPCVHSPLVQLHRGFGEEVPSRDIKELLQRLPAEHYSLLRFLCHFLTQVEQQHAHNRMTALNLATVFGPNVFHVAPGFEGIQEQNVCNKILAKLIQSYRTMFEADEERSQPPEEPVGIITVQEAHMNTGQPEPSPRRLTPRAHTPVPRKKKVPRSDKAENEDASRKKESDSKSPSVPPQKKKVKRVKSEVVVRSVPRPVPSPRLPLSRPLSQSADLASPGPRARPARQLSPRPGGADPGPPASGTAWSTETVSSSQEDERPISPFYMSSQLCPPGPCRPELTHFLERTIHSVVQQRLFDVPMQTGGGTEGAESTASSPSPAVTARQRRRQHRELDDALRPSDHGRDEVDKENIPSPRVSVREEGEGRHTHTPREGPRLRKPKHSPSLAELRPPNQPTITYKECVGPGAGDKSSAGSMEVAEGRDDCQRENYPAALQTHAMKIQETLSGSDPSEGCEDVPRLDLTTLTEDSNWGDSPFFSAPFLDFKSVFQQCCCEEPVRAYSSWQRESMDREEAQPSPHAGGRLIRQLMEEDSDPMISPRFYAYGHCQQYLNDTEVPPSPPNAHSFVSRRRSSSLGSCDDDREELTSAQISKKIHNLKRKIRKFEEKFEEERKYRPSHSDKAANPEVLRWMNELAKLRKDLKEHKLLKSEEDLTPLPRQRSNTLPKSFGSQLEKKPAEAKAPKPPVENTLDTVMNKLKEKRDEVGRPEDIKDMTREQIGAEKVALQKALLYYESIHGRPVTKTERQIMKPLYDRYRLVKQILCRASTIPVIGSPSSKRRGPLLQPIIEGEPALFFDDIKEEEDGSDDNDDNDTQTQFAVTVKPEMSVLGFLEQLDMDGFISPVDELSPSRNSTDMRLSNLHAATTQELVEQLQEAREEKKRIRKNLREFEDQFFRQNGRNVQKEDRSPLAVEYNEYKHVKAKLRLLEVLISKRDSSKFI